jgi:hypothetical protein
LQYCSYFELCCDVGYVGNFSDLDFLRRGEMAEKLKLFFFSKIIDFSKAS